MKRFAFLVLVIGCCCQSFVSLAQTSVNVLFAPTALFSEADEQGNVKGFAVDLLKGILQEAQLQGEFSSVPFARMVEMMRSDKPLVGSAMVRTPEREMDYYWITPVAVNTVSLFVREGLAQQPAVSMQTIKSVSVVRGDYREQMLRQYPHITVMPVTTWEQAIRAVELERVDGILFSHMGMISYCREQQLGCHGLRAVEMLRKHYSYVVMPRTPENSHLAARLSMAADRFKASPQGKTLAQQFITHFPPNMADVQWRDGIVDLSGTAPEIDEQSLWILAEYIPFFTVMDETGQQKGYAIELVNSILQQTNIDAPILLTPRNRMLRELEKRPNVLAFTMVHTPERDSNYHWITPLTKNIFGLYGRGDEFTDLQHLQPHQKIAVLRDDFRAEIAQQLGLNIAAFDDWPTAVTAFMDGHVDYLFATDSAIKRGCEQVNIDCQDIRRLYTHDANISYLVMSKQGTDLALVEKFRQAAAEVKQSPQHHQRVQHWLSVLAAEHGLNWHWDQGIINMWQATE